MTHIVDAHFSIAKYCYICRTCQVYM